jgi:hypothetical protein
MNEFMNTFIKQEAQYESRLCFMYMERKGTMLDVRYWRPAELQMERIRSLVVYHDRYARNAGVLIRHGHRLGRSGDLVAYRYVYNLFPDCLGSGRDKIFMQSLSLLRAGGACASLSGESRIAENLALSSGADESLRKSADDYSRDILSAPDARCDMGIQYLVLF